MARRKTTVYLDPDVLAATKVLAATRRQSPSQVVENAMRAYLGQRALEAARDGLRALMDRVAGRSGLDDYAAMELAVEEVRAVRTDPSSRRPA